MSAASSGPFFTKVEVGPGMVAAGAALIGICYGFARFSYGLFAPELQAEFDLTGAVSGVIGAGSYVGYCVAIVWSLVVTPRWGPRRVAGLAGLVATAGLVVVAVAPTAWLLAAGLLVAGSSTGIASPPLAAAVARWVRKPSQDRAQTLVNAGTGMGVLVSGPIAFALTDYWRWAWGTYAVGAAAVTWWIWVTMPGGRALADGSSERSADEPSSCRRRASGESALPLLLASFFMGLASVAVWTLGRELIVTEGDANALLAGLMWTLMGAAGIAGALSGPLVQRIGVTGSWSVLMIALAAATAGLALAPRSIAMIVIGAAVFGGAYIALTGVALLWATRIYPERTAYGVGASFLMIAVGQALGAPLAGIGGDRFGYSVVFYLCASVATAGALIPIMRSITPSTAPSE
ncbi:MFS transporter [Nocardioides bruguierae]|uniref:MFS transporter n=1 Tax=Nocardioides bruguierae TaxID=2945102 RepID=A0A9X2DBA9_9ACTN|nr:MFS transporter [Nocardioides bruguierae]MCM0622796.1 MFS transporter [Nocardioides bruguierae]